jgi:hypothetical protein
MILYHTDCDWSPERPWTVLQRRKDGVLECRACGLKGRLSNYRLHDLKRYYSYYFPIVRKWLK